MPDEPRRILPGDIVRWQGKLARVHCLWSAPPRVTIEPFMEPREIVPLSECEPTGMTMARPGGSDYWAERR